MTAPEKPRLQWLVIVSVTVFHLACIAAPFTFTWSGLAVAIALYVVTAQFGICLGFHRLFTHGSFKTNRFVRYTLAICGVLANQGPAVIWVGTHRLHHRHSDREGDPHSPAEDFSWGHVFWSFSFDHEGARRAAGDLTHDKGLALIDKYYYVPQWFLIAILYACGGISWVVWGVFVRTVFAFHCAWFVNSAAHRFGYRNFDTPDHSRNNWLVALFSFGEGWHNNHHAYQSSAAHGLRWWEIDTTYLIIRFLAWIGLATDVKLPPAEVFQGQPAAVTKS